MIVRQYANWGSLSSSENYFPKLFTFLTKYGIILVEVNNNGVL